MLCAVCCEISIESTDVEALERAAGTIELQLDLSKSHESVLVKLSLIQLRERKNLESFLVLGLFGAVLEAGLRKSEDAMLGVLRTLCPLRCEFCAEGVGELSTEFTSGG